MDKAQVMGMARIAGEAVLLALVVLLSLKVLLDNQAQRVGRPPGPNRPLKDCVFPPSTRTRMPSTNSR